MCVCRMVLAMFHQVSTQAVIRSLGISLANLLATHDASNLHPVYAFAASNAMDVD